MNFFGFGLPEILITLVIILLFFGKDRLPDLAKSIGKAFRELKSGFHDSSNKPFEDDDKKKEVDAGSEQKK